MKKTLCILLSLLFVFAGAGCRKDEGQKEPQKTTETVQGRIIAIDGTKITVELMAMGENPGAPAENPPQMLNTQIGEQPPEKPGDGAQKPEGMQEGQPPALFEGEPMEGGRGEKKTFDLEGIPLTRKGESADLHTLQTGDMLTLVLDEGGNLVSASLEENRGAMGEENRPQGFGGFGGGQVQQGTSVTTIEADAAVDGETFTSTGDDENALRIDGASVTLRGISVHKDAGASSNSETGDFYGMNAALLVTNGAQVLLENGEIASSAQNGNGVFSYGTGTVVTVKNTVITTTGDNSGGIQTTGGGATYGENLTVTTAGNSSAAIRSDRGGGTVQVTGGTYTTSGFNSPAVYSTADITVSEAVLTALSSEALVIEGKNSISLIRCQASGAMDREKSTSGSENVHAVMIYQSMSGDAEVGTSRFSMEGGSLTGQAGDLFYITNTHCIFTLQGAELVNADSDGALMRICGNSAVRGWGKAGSNGAQVEALCVAQTLNGDILVDTVSTLNLTLKQNTFFTGRILVTENLQGGTAVENNAVLTIEEGCTWSLTGDSTLSSLTNYGTILYNGFTITLSDGTVLGG